MKKVLVIGDYHDNLLEALNKAKDKHIIEDYVGYTDYLNSIDSSTDGLPKAIYTKEIDWINSLITDTFCDEYIVMKGKIHSNDFLRIVIDINKQFTEEKPFLSHCVVLQKERVKFILTDAFLPSSSNLTISLDILNTHIPEIP